MSTFLPFNSIVVSVSFPQRTTEVDVLSGNVTSCVFPDVKRPCQVVRPYTNTRIQAVAPFSPSVSLFPLVEQFFNVTATVSPFASSTRMSSLSLFFLLSLDAFSQHYRLLHSRDLLDFEEQQVLQHFDALRLLRLDRTSTLSRSAEIVCFGPDCRNKLTT